MTVRKTIKICGAVIALLFLSAPQNLIHAGMVAPVYAGDSFAWDASPGAIGYFVYYGQNENALNFKVDVGNVTQINVEDLEHIDEDYQWFLTVSAYAFNVESGKSDPILWSVNGRPRRIHWGPSKSPDVAGYRVYMANRKGIFEGDPLCDTEELNCATPVLIGGQIYKFKIIAYDKAGNFSESKEATITIPGAPSIKLTDSTPPEPVGNITFTTE